MSRATELARLLKCQVLCAWHLAYPDATPAQREWAGQYATKEQLVAQIVTKEEQCSQQPSRPATARTPRT